MNQENESTGIRRVGIVGHCVESIHCAVVERAIRLAQSVALTAVQRIECAGKSGYWTGGFRRWIQLLVDRRDRRAHCQVARFRAASFTFDQLS